MSRSAEFLLAGLMAIILVPVMAILSVVVLLVDGRPVFFTQSRMKSPTESFTLVKFRTLTVVEDEDGVLGGDKLARITPLGRILRKSRMDELPQLWNILRGDIGFVGPRPPLRRYVERFPEIYGEVLKGRPGVTGLATLLYHGKEEVLMAQCRTGEEAEAVYERVCVPAKARLDLLYAKHKSPCLDLRMIVATLWRRLPPVPRPRRKL
ncbi:sugar transferase [Shimia sp. FJ5]|uniref:sugar transferase n=1 Tax=Shimia sp. FJ5 TaxID=3079054 RepID=UPI0026380C07|nr:sugar transferase [Shimia sp. FJ5]MDV4144716.1 sugar transferase [Shimia sp. FJ5]